MPDGMAPPFLFGALLLAAGGSSRMGTAKQLLEIDGRSLVARAVGAALDSQAKPVVVVVGANAERVRDRISGCDVLIAHNEQWASGLASSIRTGLAALLAAEPALDAVLVAPCDQPALSSSAISRLGDLHRATGKIAAARYGGRNGAPAVFGRRKFADLAALSGDAGARALLNADPAQVASLDLPEMAFDLDTPAEYAAWKNGRP